MAINILAPLGITAAASAIDAGIQKKIHGSGSPSSSASQTTTLIISNEEMNDIMRIVEHVPEEIKEFIDHCFLNSSTSYRPSSSASQNKNNN